eukprot:TRINITY_DN75151_c0_g1_i1.p1 TRINITY_DN75151_c0_g1~~TRINITY_DN75151_c0_g1_i1.p1  ORF type:complete len:136 (-),score=8.70 TRINITY_DN75151_c0_g1_i1:111-518(-)
MDSMSLRTARSKHIITSLHVGVLVAFLSLTPFFFENMPSDSSVASPGGQLPVRSSERADGADDGASSGASDTSALRPLGHTGDARRPAETEAKKEQRACRGFRAGSLVALLLPVSVTVAGGSLVSLDYFDAIPVM